ncbi:MAG: hypothetical protein JOY62_15180 [Acidobacteriaceae bacterium]|nr:hypothetical protein [Acidobacteriaceae bacterium]MBV9781305.1 hypothetical protein [Acidobacteriaceae bacterium]
MKSEKVLRIVLLLILAGQLLATITGGLNRTLVEMPAWRYLGAEAWAAFSRRADLGNGEIMYPLAGIGETVLLLAAAITFRLSPKRPLFVAIPLYGAAVMSICVMLTTTQAAPIMLSLPRIGNSRAALQQAFEGFYRWDSIRAVFGVLAGCAEVLALVALGSWAFGKKSSLQEQPLLHG